jgi:predicted GNAT family N-acyltransferase
MSTTELRILYGGTEELIDDTLTVRRAVFIEEQNVSEEREFDGLETGSTHYVGYMDGEPVAAARTRRIYLGTDDLGSHDVKIERVSVLARHRGKGIGNTLMARILDQLPPQPLVRDAILESQIHALDFYGSLGFIPVGHVFKDAGIPHKKMRKPIHADTVYRGQSFTK